MYWINVFFLLIPLLLVSIELCVYVTYRIRNKKARFKDDESIHHKLYLEKK